MSWIDLELTGSFEAWNGPYFSAQCKKDNNIVYFRGLINVKKAGVWSVITTIPVHLRPERDFIGVVANNDKVTSISIRRNGNIQLRPGTIVGHLSLDGLFYHLPDDKSGKDCTDSLGGAEQTLHGTERLMNATEEIVRTMIADVRARAANKAT